MRDSAGYNGVWDAGRRVVRLDDNGTYAGYIAIDRMSGPVDASFRSHSFGEPGKLARHRTGYIADAYHGQVVRTKDLWKGCLVFMTRVSSS